MQNIELIDFNLFKPLRTAIVHANNDLSILSAIKAYELGLIDPIFISKEAIVRKIFKKKNFQYSNLIIDSENEEKSAQIACNMAKNNEISLIVKGHMHSDTLMSEFIKPDYNLLIKGTRLSHIWLMSFEDNRDQIIITDGALNIKPSQQTKQKIIENALKFVNKIDNFNPKIAILSATEKVLTSLESSVEAEKIMHWANKIFPQVPVFGPLAFDNAISEEAAKIKETPGEVAGKANILVVPNIETGNALVKVMVNFMNATAGGFVTSGKIPVVITSRSHSVDCRVSSIVNAILSVN
jgi:phosphate acetyltransferase